MVQHWVSHLDIMMVFCLPLIKALNLALLMVNFLVSYFELIMDTHLVLMKELIWVILISDLLVPMK